MNKKKLNLYFINFIFLEKKQNKSYILKKNAN